VRESLRGSVISGPVYATSAFRGDFTRQRTMEIFGDLARTPATDPGACLRARDRQARSKNSPCSKKRDSLT